MEVEIFYVKCDEVKENALLRYLFLLNYPLVPVNEIFLKNIYPYIILFGKIFLQVNIDLFKLVF